MEQVRVGFVGVGGRGRGLIMMMLDHMPIARITAICDLYPDRVENMQKLVQEKQGHTPFGTQDYHTLFDRDDVDCIVCPAAWSAHTQIALDCMNAGMPVGMEVGGAHSLEECFELVRTYEKTKSPIMLLENCCYGQEEMTILNMIKKGVFGEVVHCEGGYRHDLRDEVAMGHVNRHYRLDQYLNRNGELYPTHELGPIAKYLNINRGNRMLMLTSMASKSVGINEWIRTRRGENFENAHTTFTQGDVVTTCIKCAHGETIVLTHDTSLPRPYSRGNLVEGTKGIWSEEKHGIYLDGTGESYEWGETYRDISEYYEQYQHPLWRDFDAVGGHGGIDLLVLQAFFEAVRDKAPMPIDVYDMAAWMSITPLSEQSIAMGSMPVAIPDFTNGRWCRREPFARGKYCLEDVCEECFEAKEPKQSEKEGAAAAS